MLATTDAQKARHIVWLWIWMQGWHTFDSAIQTRRAAVAARHGARSLPFLTDRFTASYDELQPVPLLKVGLLTYAGDDGRAKGQAYRLALDLDAGVAHFRFRYPDEAGVWRWRTGDTFIALPDCLKERLSHGKLMAPTLREEYRADGERFAVLDFIIEIEKEEHRETLPIRSI